jgi:hypothetical protein
MLLIIGKWWMIPHSITCQVRAKIVFMQSLNIRPPIFLVISMPKRSIQFKHLQNLSVHFEIGQWSKSS